MMLWRRVESRSYPRHLRQWLILPHPQLRDSEISDLDDLVIPAQQKIVGLEVTVNDAAAVRIGQALTDLAEVEEALRQAQRIAWLLAAALEQIPSRHVLQDQVVKRSASQIRRRPVPQPQDDVRMADRVERDRLVLEILDQSPLQIRIRRALQSRVEGLDHHLLRQRRLGIGRR